MQGTLGPVFGANDYWNGMAVMLDSFDNDGQKNNPYISLMINDGTRSYDHQTDGSQQILNGFNFFNGNLKNLGHYFFIF